MTSNSCTQIVHPQGVELSAKGPRPIYPVALWLLDSGLLNSRKQHIHLTVDSSLNPGCLPYRCTLIQQLRVSGLHHITITNPFYARLLYLLFYFLTLTLTLFPTCVFAFSHGLQGYDYPSRNNCPNNDCDTVAGAYGRVVAHDTATCAILMT